MSECYSRMPTTRVLALHLEQVQAIAAPRGAKTPPQSYCKSGLSCSPRSACLPSQVDCAGTITCRPRGLWQHLRKIFERRGWLQRD